MASHADFSNADAKHSFDPARSSELTRSKVSPFGKRRALLCTSRTPDYAALLNYSAAYPLSLLRLPPAGGQTRSFQPYLYTCLFFNKMRYLVVI